VRGLLISDLRAAFVGDPAARNFPEILIGYPGMTFASICAAFTCGRAGADPPRGPDTGGALSRLMSDRLG